MDGTGVGCEHLALSAVEQRRKSLDRGREDGDILGVLQSVGEPWVAAKEDCELRGVIGGEGGV